KRWLRKEELLADAAEKASIAAEWLGARTYPRERLYHAWTLVMGGHFHDIAAGTATPKSYEFAWNDDVIAMNQFAGVLTNATEGVAAALNTEVKGVPVVVFNPLNIAREDVVEASVEFPGGVPQAVHVTGPGGNEAPAQISGGKILFLAQVPPTAYAVYDVQPGEASGTSTLKVSNDSLENQYYRVRLNGDGDVASIFDKTIGKELLSAPARLAISYDNPQQWPAWNMDWDQERTPPKAYVSGPPKIRVAENGPARVALEVSRETAGSAFVETIRLSAGDAGKRVEVGHVGSWRDGQTDWQGQRLNAPPIAFETSKHAGALGQEFSLLKVSNPRIRVLTLKKAEQSEENIVRMVELDGKPQENVRVSFASPVVAAREVNGQEQPMGPATVSDGAVVTSFSAYQPRTFAVKLAATTGKASSVHSAPVKLRYDLATASNDGTKSSQGFDG